MGFFGRKKRNNKENYGDYEEYYDRNHDEEDEYDDSYEYDDRYAYEDGYGEIDISDIDMKNILSERAKNRTDDRLFDTVSRVQYIRNQCEQVNESSRYVEQVRDDYKDVISHLKDIQNIEKLEKQDKEKMSSLAKKIDELENERRAAKKKSSKLSLAKYDYYNNHKDELVDALKKMQNDEQYFQMVKKDLAMLEVEKEDQRHAIESYASAQEKLKKVSVWVLVLAAVAFFAVVILSMESLGNNGYLITVLLFVITAFVVVVFLAHRSAVYNQKLSEKRLNKAILLQNKIKIKYINIVNSIEYQYAKYAVHNSLEFANTYQMYLEDKKDREYMKQTAGDFHKAVDELGEFLENIGVEDVDMWLSVSDVFYSEDKFNEIKVNYLEQRAKLKEQIEYNLDKIEEAKNNITEYVKKNQRYKKEAMDIVKAYEKENRKE